MKISIKKTYTLRGVLTSAVFALILCVGFFTLNFSTKVEAQERVSISTAGTIQNSTQAPFVWEDYQDPSRNNKHRSFFRVVFDFIWKLIIVVILLYVTIRFLKLIYSSKAIKGPSGTLFTLLDTFYLKPNQAMYLVEITDRYFVMAGSAQSLNVVCEITDKAKIDQIKSDSISGINFKDNLAGMIGKKSLSLEDRIAAGSQKILEQINKLSGR